MPSTLGLHLLGCPCSQAGRAGWHDVRGGRLPSASAGAPVWGLVAAEDLPGTPVALEAETVSASCPTVHQRPHTHLSPPHLAAASPPLELSSDRTNLLVWNDCSRPEPCGESRVSLGNEALGKGGQQPGQVAEDQEGKEGASPDG